jgi:carboxypeptidase family protein
MTRALSMRAGTLITPCLLTGLCLSASLPAMAQSSLGGIVGLVVDDIGAPVSDVKVLLGRGEEGLTVAETVTDSRGSFTFGDLRPGLFSLAYLPPGASDLVGDYFLPRPLVTPPTQRLLAGEVIRVVRTLERGGRIDTILDADPSIRQCPCDVEISRPGGLLTPGPEVHDRTLVFHGVPPAADYVVKFKTEGYATQRLAPVAVLRAQSTRLSFRYEPNDPTGLVGTLRMAGGSPLASYSVRAKREGESGPEDASEARTDATGHFAIVGLAPGVYVLDVDGVPLARVGVVLGARSSADLVWGRPISFLDSPMLLPRGHGSAGSGCLRSVSLSQGRNGALT